MTTSEITFITPSAMRRSRAQETAAEPESALDDTPYAGYTYAYPHKTAYRPFDPPIPLQTLWAGENQNALFLYMHIPFCEMRCGFCNLFTTTNANEDFTQAYLRAMRRQAAQVRNALGDVRFARFAIGGGTPTFLDVSGLETLFQIAEEEFGVNPNDIPVGVETSPRTAEPEKLRLLRERGVDRISMGIQSFIEAEANAAGRAQKTVWVETALEQIRSAGFPTLNIDLIYGLPGQTIATWLFSLQSALRYKPEEIFLYPLYVRPLTGLGRKADALTRSVEAEGDIRLACYRAGRDFLTANGYRQVSMRMFALDSGQTDGIGSDSSENAAKSNVAYCCQEDGMVGLGCGARSYTHSVHYASEYAVGATGVRAILRDYVAKPEADFAFADYGCTLDADEQRRRHLLQSLLQVAGMDSAAYRLRFGTDPLTDFPELSTLEARGLLTQDAEGLRLTPAGIERSDSIGPWLYSPAVRQRMAAYDLH